VWGRRSRRADVQSAPNLAKIGFLHADAQRLPLRDQTFDAVISLACCSWYRTGEALARWRGCCPGGRLVVMVPTAGRAAGLARAIERRTQCSTKTTGDSIARQAGCTASSRTITTSRRRAAPRHLANASPGRYNCSTPERSRHECRSRSGSRLRVCV